MKKKLPIGIDGFEKIRTNDFYYIDKTRFIAELLHNWGEVNLFTRPRRFGKTLNMSMLKCFFEIGSNRALFDGLQIAHEKELCQQYQGQFPVLFLSLKSVDGLTFEAAEAALRTVVGSEAGRFRFLKDSDKLDESEKKTYLRLIDVKIENETGYAMSDSDLVASLKTLSMLLAKHYGRKVIVLIDEYDVPLDKAFQAGYYDEMVALLRNLFGNALKTNDSLQFAVLTGCLRISKESIFTGLNNLKVHTISDMRYDEYFGFTDGDVDELLAFYGLSAYKDTMHDWYDGYLFGGVHVYCPWDVINYCDVLLADSDAEPENYWANTSGNGIIRRLLQKADQTTREEVERLLNGESIVKTVRQELTCRDIEDSIDNIWSVLYSTGYLTQEARLPGKQMKLILPNREVRELFADLVKDWFRETTRSFPNLKIPHQKPTLTLLPNNKIWEVNPMKRLISCEYNFDNCRVELKFTDSSMIAIDTIAVENEVVDNMYQRSELDYLIYNDPIAYADLVLNGDPETYLKAVTEYKPLD